MKLRSVEPNSKKESEMESHSLRSIRELVQLCRFEGMLIQKEIAMTRKPESIDLESQKEYRLSRLHQDLHGPISRLSISMKSANFRSQFAKLPPKTQITTVTGPKCNKTNPNNRFTEKGDLCSFLHCTRHKSYCDSTSKSPIHSP